MKILKIKKVNTFLFSIMMLAILLSWSNLGQASQDVDFTYSITGSSAQITGYIGTGGDIAIPTTLGGATVTSIGNQAFDNKNTITSISIPLGVTSIGNGAFNGLIQLTSISLPFGLTSIGDYAFNACIGLTSISIPPGVTSIGSRPFAYCTSLTNISVDIDNSNYQSIGGVLYNKAGTSLLAFPGGLTSISIPPGVTSIGYTAFYGCSGLTSIILPQEVTSIGDYAFFDCTTLSSIRFNSATTSISDSASTIPVVTKIIGYDPSTAKVYATKYSRQFEVIPPTITLQSIAITTPATKLSYIEGETLDITGIVVTGTYSDNTSHVVSITDGNITGFNSASPASNQIITIAVGGKTTTYQVQIEAASHDADYTFTITDNQAQITGYAGAGGAIIIPSTLGGDPVTSIGFAAFANCTSLTSVSLPQGITNIGNSAFKLCNALASIRFNSATTTIFDDVDTIPAGTKIIGYDPSTAKDYAAHYNRPFEVINAISTTLGVSLNKNDTTINVGAYETLVAFITPDQATNGSVTWSVYSQSMNNVVSVSSIGRITAVNQGTAVVRAISNADPTKYAECRVTVIVGAAVDFSATPLVQIGINPLYGDSAGIFVGLKDIMDASGIPVTNQIGVPAFAGYQIEIFYDHNQVKVLDVYDEAHLGNFVFNNTNPNKISVADMVYQGTNNFEKLFFVPLALIGTSSYSTEVTIKFTSLSDTNWNHIVIPDVTLTLQRGKIANEASHRDLSIVDSVAGLQYLAKLRDAGTDTGTVNVINMASILSPESGATSIKPSVRDVIALMQKLVGLRDDLFQLVSGS